MDERLRNLILYKCYVTDAELHGAADMIGVIAAVILAIGAVGFIIGLVWALFKKK